MIASADNLVVRSRRGRVPAAGSVLACCVAAIGLLGAVRAHAQPGPGPPVTLADARRVVNIVMRGAARTTALAAAPSARVAAARATADALTGLASSLAADPVRVDDGVEPLLRAKLGFGVAELRARGDDAWATCRRIVAETHGYDDDARACLLRGRFGGERAPLFALPPDPVLARASSADASAARVRALLDRMPSVPASTLMHATLLGSMAYVGDVDGARAVIGPLAGVYDADVTMGVALHRARRPREALSALASAAVQQVGRPEAWHDLAIVLDEETLAPALPLAAQYRVRFAMARAYLCTRSNGRLAEPDGAWERGAHIADSAQWQGYGASHSTWRANTPRPPPFVDDASMPPTMRGDPRPPDRRCTDVVDHAVVLARVLAGPGTLGELPRLVGLPPAQRAR